MNRIEYLFSVCCDKKAPNLAKRVSDVLENTKSLEKYVGEVEKIERSSLAKIKRGNRYVSSTSFNVNDLDIITLALTEEEKQELREIGIKISQGRSYISYNPRTDTVDLFMELILSALVGDNSIHEFATYFYLNYKLEVNTLHILPTEDRSYVECSEYRDNSFPLFFASGDLKNLQSALLYPLCNITKESSIFDNYREIHEIALQKQQGQFDSFVKRLDISQKYVEDTFKTEGLELVYDTLFNGRFYHLGIPKVGLFLLDYFDKNGKSTLLEKDLNLFLTIGCFTCDLTELIADEKYLNLQNLSLQEINNTPIEEVVEFVNTVTTLIFKQNEKLIKDKEELNKQLNDMLIKLTPAINKFNEFKEELEKINSSTREEIFYKFDKVSNELWDRRTAWAWYKDHKDLRVILDCLWMLERTSHFDNPFLDPFYLFGLGCCRSHSSKSINRKKER